MQAAAFPHRPVPLPLPGAGRASRGGGGWRPWRGGTARLPPSPFPAAVFPDRPVPLPLPDTSRASRGGRSMGDGRWRTAHGSAAAVGWPAPGGCPGAQPLCACAAAPVGGPRPAAACYCHTSFFARPPPLPRRAAAAKGWKLWHSSCFRNDQDGPTTSDDGSGFVYVAQSESPSRADVEEEEEVGGSSGEQGQNYKDGGWFLQVQKIKENLHGRIIRFQAQCWTVPWTGQTIAQVMILWIATFWFVGSWIVPFLAHVAGFSKETLTHRGQALYSLLTDITEGLAGIAILHQCLGRFRPLPPGWFEFNLKGKWHFDVALGCLLFPLVNLLSHINISLVPMSPGPVVGVSSVEQSIVARDPVAMALYAVVVTVCAPIWEEIVFRGFLLPSLTRYMPLPWSILASAAAFALAHFNAQRVMPLVFLGVVMGGVFARSRNLLASMVLHSLWNGFVFLDLMK